MTINNLDKYINTLWDWGFLDGCFGKTGIRVTDIDGMVERNGRFLVIETKSNGANIPIGQQRMFQAMADDGKFTVIVVWGDANQPTKMRITAHNGTRVVIVEKPANIEDLQDAVKRWFVYADSMH